MEFEQTITTCTGKKWKVGFMHLMVYRINMRFMKNHEQIYLEIRRTNMQKLHRFNLDLVHGIENTIIHTYICISHEFMCVLEFVWLITYRTAIAVCRISTSFSSSLLDFFSLSHIYFYSEEKRQNVIDLVWLRKNVSCIILISICCISHNFSTNDWPRASKTNVFIYRISLEYIQCKLKKWSYA